MELAVLDAWLHHGPETVVYAAVVNATDPQGHAIKLFGESLAWPHSGNNRAFSDLALLAPTPFCNAPAAYTT